MTMVNLPMYVKRKLLNVYDTLSYCNPRYRELGDTKSIMFTCTANPDNPNEIFVPSYIRHMVPNAKIDKPTTLVHRLITSDLAVEKKTANSIVEYLLNNVTSTLNKSVTPSGYTFYGNMGMLIREIDDILYPLMVGMSGIDFSKNKHTRNILFVDKRVFSNDDLVSKFIIKKAIPFYTDTYSTHQIIDVIVKDLQQHFIRVAAPCELYDRNKIYDSLSPVV